MPLIHSGFVDIVWIVLLVANPPDAGKIALSLVPLSVIPNQLPWSPLGSL